MIDPGDPYAETTAKLDAGYERLYNFVVAAADGLNPPRDGWRGAIHDAALGIDRIVQRNAHPDDVLHARSAMDSLAGIWLSVEETEDVFLGERATGEPEMTKNPPTDSGSPEPDGIETRMLDLAGLSLRDLASHDDLDAAVAHATVEVQRERKNLGSSGPPGRED